MRPDPLAAVVARMERERVPYLDRFCPRCHREYVVIGTCYQCREEAQALRVYERATALLKRLREPIPSRSGGRSRVREATDHLPVVRIVTGGDWIRPIK